MPTPAEWALLGVLLAALPPAPAVTQNPTLPPPPALLELLGSPDADLLASEFALESKPAVAQRPRDASLRPHDARRCAS